MLAISLAYIFPSKGLLVFIVDASLNFWIMNLENMWCSWSKPFFLKWWNKLSFLGFPGIEIFVICCIGHLRLGSCTSNFSFHLPCTLDHLKLCLSVRFPFILMTKKEKHQIPFCFSFSCSFLFSTLLFHFSIYLPHQPPLLSSLLFPFLLLLCV